MNNGIYQMITEYIVFMKIIIDCKTEVCNKTPGVSGFHEYGFEIGKRKTVYP